MADYSDILAQYRKIRELARERHSSLFKMIPQKAVEECGHRLGMIKRGVFVFASEVEGAVLMDHCIYDYLTNGKNVIDRYYEKSPPPAGTDEAMLSEAMLKARYSLFTIKSLVPGVGVMLDDNLYDEEVFLVDVGFSHTGTAGLPLATRITRFADFAMTTGAGLPLDQATGEKIVLRLESTPMARLQSFSDMTREQQSKFAEIVIRTALEKNASSYIAYEDSWKEGAALPRRSAPSAIPHTRPASPGRNEPCPCGSGKKFKHCCGM